MTENKGEIAVPDEVIMNKIFLIRGKKVMFDRDLAELYGVETKQLKRAVKRNIERFPEDFMFEMKKEELENWRCQFGTSNKEKMGLRIPPYVFTEHGAVMLASVLNNERAIKVNIQIIRIFNRMCEMLLAHKDILFQFFFQLKFHCSLKSRKIHPLFFQFTTKHMALRLNIRRSSA